MGVATTDQNFIFDKVKGHHYQVACGKYFEAKHKGSALMEADLGGISHPNQFFEESQKFHAAADGATAGAVAPKAEAASSVAQAVAAN